MAKELQNKIEWLKTINSNYELTSQQLLNNRKTPTYARSTSKVVSSLETAIKQVGLQSGMTISFHHHFRHGDYTIKAVLKTIAAMGIKDLTISASSFTKAHDCLVDYIKQGVVTGLEGSGLRGILGDAISNGLLVKPVILRSHGGRARAIIQQDFQIDVAFLSATSADEMGNANGVNGESICGSMGYAMVDARYASKVVILTDNLVEFPNNPISIPATQVDFVVVVDAIGDPKKIASGEIHETFTLKEAAIAENIAKIVVNTQYFKSGFSYQSGTGGASQASLKLLKEAMVQKKIKASFFLGGINKDVVQMLNENLVDRLLDVQCFDLVAVQSLQKNPCHSEIDASYYASVATKMCAVNKLDYGVLSALEIDTNFNVNVMTGADGHIRGAIGGHQDVAAGSKITIVAVPLFRGRIPSINKVTQTIITPGFSVDAVVCEYGIAINPLRQDLIDELQAACIELKTIDELYAMAIEFTGQPEQIPYDKNHVIAIVEYLDGSVIDLIYKVKKLDLKLNN